MICSRAARVSGGSASWRRATSVSGSGTSDTIQYGRRLPNSPRLSLVVSGDGEKRLLAVTSRARLSALMRRCYAPPFLCPAISLIAPTVAGGRVDAIGLDGTGHRPG